MVVYNHAVELIFMYTYLALEYVALALCTPRVVISACYQRFIILA